MRSNYHSNIRHGNPIYYPQKHYNWGRGNDQIMCTHVSKCKNDKIKLQFNREHKIITKMYFGSSNILHRGTHTVKAQ
jgi:hypothetical protein